MYLHIILNGLKISEDLLCKFDYFFTLGRIEFFFSALNIYILDSSQHSPVIPTTVYLQKVINENILSLTLFRFAYSLKITPVNLEKKLLVQFILPFISSK